MIETALSVADGSLSSAPRTAAAPLSQRCQPSHLGQG